MSATSRRQDWRGAYTRYTGVAIALHWTIAGMILLNIAGGLLMTSGLLPNALNFPAYQWHKTIGLLVLALTVSRILWRLGNPPPAHAPTMARHERLAAEAVHYAFYALMLIVPLVGWLVVSTSRAEVPTYLFMLEALPWPSLPIREAVSAGTLETLETIFAFSHKWLALSFLGLLALHVAGAVKHAVVDRNPSLARMTKGSGLAAPRMRRGALPVAVLGFCAVMGLGLLGGQAGRIGASDTGLAAAGDAAAPSQAPDASARPGGWSIDRAASSLGFTVPFSGSPVTGTIDDWTADIVFAPDALDTSRAEIAIRTASISVDSSFVDPQVTGKDGFASTDFPQAELQLDSFAASDAGPNAYTGTGTLTIKGNTQPITVPFTFVEGTDGTATVEGSAEIDRTVFALGMSNDPTGSYLGKQVTVGFELSARR